MAEIDETIRDGAGRAALEMRRLSRATGEFTDPDTTLVVLMNLRVVLEQAAQTIERMVEVHDRHTAGAPGWDITATSGEPHARTAWAALVEAKSLAHGARDQVTVATAEIGQISWPDWKRTAIGPAHPQLTIVGNGVDLDDDLDLDYGDDGLDVNA